MDEIRIPIHSIVDVITNSSTELYTFPNDNAVELTIDLINQIMKVFNIEGDATDYFDICLVRDIDNEDEDSIIDDFIWNDIWWEREDIMLESGGLDDSYDGDDWEEKRTDFIKKLIANNDPRLFDIDGVEPHRKELKIIPKTDVNNNLTEMLKNIYITEEVNC